VACTLRHYAQRMGLVHRVVGLFAVVSVGGATLVGCGSDERTVFGNGGGGGFGGFSLFGGDGGTDGTGAVGTGAASPGGMGTGGVAGGGGSPAAPVCDAPAAPPSNGACIAALSDDVKCNPVTNEPCSEVCGNYGLGKFQCYTVTSMVGLCADCSTDICGGGYACPADADWPGGERCAKYCCEDSDCGSGVCFKDGISTSAAPVGICLGD